MKLNLVILLVLFLTTMVAPVFAGFCPACGTEVAEQDVFCRKCGIRLGPQAPADVSVDSPTTSAGYQVVNSTNHQPRPFQVTTHYLNVNGYRLPRHSYFWIAEVAGSQARVWSREGPPYDSLIMGWVSLTELEKRSTIVPGSTIVCVEPPPPTTAKVVVVERVNFWRNWGPGPFFTPRYYHGRHWPHGRSHCPP